MFVVDRVRVSGLPSCLLESWLLPCSVNCKLIVGVFDRNYRQHQLITSMICNGAAVRNGWTVSTSFVRLAKLFPEFVFPHWFTFFSSQPGLMFLGHRFFVNAEAYLYVVSRSATCCGCISWVCCCCCCCNSFSAISNLPIDAEFPPVRISPVALPVKRPRRLR